ncbi:MAG: GNAT family N-acetyltransferase [Pyrinomonadaceae bacterium]
MLKSMPDTERVQIRLLVESDIPAAMQLKELARWNQTESDWRCLLRLGPGGCFGAWLDGSLVGTTTTTTYDPELGWIGMVLVNPENRRRGIATRLIKTALDYLSGKVLTVKLDATPEGQPVYEGLGFEVESLIERWAGIARAAPISFSNQIETTAELDIEARSELLALDRRAFGVDRSRLIEMLIEKACIAPVLARAADGRLSGYALAREGSNADYIGPLVTTDVAQAAPLLDRVLAQLTGRQVYVDVNSACETGAGVLADRGFVKQRDLIRMSYGTKTNTTSPWILAIAGPEVG